MRIFTIVFAGLFFHWAGFSESVWLENIEVAQKIATKNRCPLFIAFLGPNWCSFSDALENEVLSQNKLSSLLGENVVFVKIDIPEDFEEASYYGKDLKEKFQIDRCPCLVLANEELEVIAKLKHLPTSCELVAESVQQILEDYEKVSHLARREIRQMKIDELKHLYARSGKLADATFKAALLKQGLKIDRGSYFLVEEYGNKLASGASSPRKLMRIRSKAVARDPNNEQGSLRKLALIDFETKQVIDPLLTYLKQFGSEDTENAWKLEMKISQFLFSKNQIEEALKHARLCYDIAPNDAKQDVAQSIEYIGSFVR